MISIRATLLQLPRLSTSIRPAAKALRPLAVRTMAAAPGNTYQMLIYNYVDGMLEKRTPFRDAHLKLAGGMSDEGKLMMGGALTDPVDTGILIFRNMTKEEVESFAKRDPYVLNNLVTSWKVRQYMSVVGDSK
ncbi:hypothetical protein H632_c2652p0 [Helicosporidium sp. ATCC 50920]|nr:hypothetical protein H632_c2652p0 [Helicosporidium sp. ATCC 50920]|eukprot:KDD72995.1 hypothetical protein H632_c2652p0 [Helicosporidium sp. ATCC 50920]